MPRRATATAADFGVATLKGDIRDMILDTIRHAQDGRKWPEWPEARQADLIYRAEQAAEHIVTGAMYAVAGGGFPALAGSLESVTVKGGLKASVKMLKGSRNMHDLVEAEGGQVVIVIADPEQFFGEREARLPRPDQPALMDDEA